MRKKIVPLYLGEGEDRRKIGSCEVNQDGTVHFVISKEMSERLGFGEFSPYSIAPSKDASIETIDVSGQWLDPNQVKRDLINPRYKEK